jgi:hypothetical protein
VVHARADRGLCPWPCLRRPHMKLQQGFSHGLSRQLPHGSFSAKLHFALGRVNIHVHGGGVEFEEQTADGITALHQSGVIPLNEREVESAVLHRAPVHEKMLVIACGARNSGAPMSPQTRNVPLSGWTPSDPSSSLPCCRRIRPHPAAQRQIRRATASPRGQTGLSSAPAMR